MSIDGDTVDALPKSQSESLLPTSLTLAIEERIARRKKSNAYECDLKPERKLSTGSDKSLIKIAKQYFTNQSNVKFREIDLITLNIRGYRYQMSKSMFEDLPIHETLRRVAFLYHNKITKEEELFIDRDVQSFLAILEYVKSGQLHRPVNVCHQIFKKELEYWKIDDVSLSTCCFIKLVTSQKDLAGQLSYVKKFHLKQPEHITASLVGNAKRFYDFFYRPNSSPGALIYKFIYIAFLLLTLFQTMADSSLYFRSNTLETENWVTFYENNVSGLTRLCTSSNGSITQDLKNVCDAYGIDIPSAKKAGAMSNSSVSSSCESKIETIQEGVIKSVTLRKTSEDCALGCVTSNQNGVIGLPGGISVGYLWMDILGYLCLCFLSLDYVFRFAASPDRKSYLLSVSNSINILSIIGFILYIIFGKPPTLPREKFNDEKLVAALKIMKVIIVLSIKRYSKSFSVLLYACKKSLISIITFIFLISSLTLILAVILFSQEEGTFETFGKAYYFAITTMTLLGIGDPLPISKVSHIAIGLFSIFGVLTVSAFLPFVVSDFSFIYELSKNDYYLEKREKAKRNVIQILRMPFGIDRKAKLHGQKVIKTSVVKSSDEKGSNLTQIDGGSPWSVIDNFRNISAVPIDSVRKMLASPK